MPRTAIPLAAVAAALEELFIAAPGTRLRREDLQKAEELRPLLDEIDRAAGETGRRPGVLVDAAAGKAAVGLIAAELVLVGRRRAWQVLVLERDPTRASACREAAARLRARIPVEVRLGDVGDPALWPEAPDLVVGLHACGPASDAIIDRATAAGARRLLVVPCCYGAGTGSPAHAGGGPGRPPGQALAARLALRLGLPRQALVGRRFSQAIIDAERTLRLEACGYQTEVVELFPVQVSPHNLLWRARRVGEPARAAEAARRLAALREHR